MRYLTEQEMNKILNFVEYLKGKKSITEALIKASESGKQIRSTRSKSDRQGANPGVSEQIQSTRSKFGSQ